MSEQLRARLSAHTTISETGCHEWTGSLFWCGYGHVKVGGRGMYAHRVAYEIEHGPIPAGLVIDHLCRNRKCINPAHLEAVTHAENMKRGLRATRTHCKREHAYTPANTYINSRGNRVCRTCRNEESAARRALERANRAPKPKVSRAKVVPPDVLAVALQEAAALFGVTVAEIEGRSLRRPVILARNNAIRRLRAQLGADGTPRYSYSEVWTMVDSSRRNAFAISARTAGDRPCARTPGRRIGGRRNETSS